jgi:biotin synthase
MENFGFPNQIRVSLGSAIVLGLLIGKLDIKPTTVYLLMCRDSKCIANCGFCPQARNSKGKANLLSRVTWPIFKTEKLIRRIEKIKKNRKIKRICIQSLNYPDAYNDVLFFVKELRTRIDIPISVSSKPIKREKMKKWKEAGVNRISIALDGATKKIFEKVKGSKINGPYRWEKQIGALKDAISVFGTNSVNTHLIVGLGETEKELSKTIQMCVDIGVKTGLFAFTPIPGTFLEDFSPPKIDSYRRIQVANFLLVNKKLRFENIEFEKNGRITNFRIKKEIIQEIINSGEPFLTSGCTGCNRPFYNEKPGGPLYNFPRNLFPEEIEEAKRYFDN